MLLPSEGGPSDEAAPGAVAPSRHGSLAWLSGLLILAGVALAITHATEGAEFVRLLERAEPRWLLAALACQALTYVFAASVWQRSLAHGGATRSLRELVPLALAKLFTDQAAPSAGVSGSLLVFRALQRRAIPRAVAVDALIAGIAGYYFANALAAVAAVGLLALRGEAGVLVLIPAGAVCALALLVPAAILRIRSGGADRLTRALRRLPGARAALEAIAGVTGHRPPTARLFVETTLLQLAIVAIDAVTLGLCLRATGVAGDLAVVFPAFVIASAVASLGWVPGGIGTFEATCISLLHLHGIPLEAAVAGTLLLRGLTFWLPMVPGLVLAQREAAGGRADPSEIRGAAADGLDTYWSLSADELFAWLGSSARGLAAEEARARLEREGPNAVEPESRSAALRLLLRQFQSPLVVLLVAAAGIAALVREWTDAVIVLAILLATSALGFAQEWRASAAVERLRARVRTQVRVRRDGGERAVPAEEIVPGDVVALSAGSLIPADGVVLEARDLFVTQAALTGESMPVEKETGASPASAALAERTGCVFMGTSVRSGTGLALIVRTGGRTAFGNVAARLRVRPPETEFQRGIRQYGLLLTQIVLVLVVVVFAANIFLARPPVEALLFAMALAVGLSPELLPAIIEVTLSRGARVMAKSGVIVRRLEAIENLGSMDVLCTDKTGTLTAGVLDLEGAWDAQGAACADVERLAVENARLQTGLPSALDDALVAHAQRAGIAATATKLDEIPYDFVRKRMTVVLREADGTRRLVMKGAVANVLACCDRVREGGAEPPLDASRRAAIDERFARWSGEGLRVLALAASDVAERERYGKYDEAGLCLFGFLAFSDPPREDARAALAALAALGVQVKIVTGDNHLVAAHLARAVGLPADRVLTGRDLGELRDEALWHLAPQVAVFAEVDPNQKERVILALKKTGHVVGFLGDGINDAPALHAADVGISVDEAVDVAKEAADFVLLEHSLDVLRRGIELGRGAFANTLKYIQITTSANFGNMLSMAAASFFLPFLPLLAHQILLNNFLSDIPALGIAGDSVDRELVAKPRRFEIAPLRRFMLVFGLISSAFDAVTFGALWLISDGNVAKFRTGWFVESLLTELAIALIVRTRRACWRSRPGRLLWMSSVAVALFALALPFLPGARTFDFVPIPASLLATLVGICVAYAGASELAKYRFYRARPTPS